MGIQDGTSNLSLAKEVWLFLVSIWNWITILGRSWAVSWRIGENLGRKLLIYSPIDPIDSMESEIKVLRSSHNFIVPDPIRDFKSLDQKDLDEAGVIIIGYTGDKSHFGEVVKLAASKDKPLIIYTFRLSNPVSKDHLANLANYKWHTLASMPLRLVSDIFSILMTFKYDGK